MASLTSQGRAIHDRIRDLALERERALLSVLSNSESDTLLRLLKRLHDNLPEVEVATAEFVDEHYPRAAGSRRRAGK